MSSISVINVSFQPGYKYTIHAPTGLSEDGGFFPRRGKAKKANGDLVDLQNGFYIEVDEVGKIDYVHKDKVAIDYKHLLAAENIVWFCSAQGERAKIMISPMVVHDHASIATGGPAYGTYFSYVDDNTTKGGDN